MIPAELAQRRFVQLQKNLAQFLGIGITGREARSINLAQGADEGVSVLVADFAILVAMAIVETGLVHAALPGSPADSILPPRQNGNLALQPARIRDAVDLDQSGRVLPC